MSGPGPGLNIGIYLFDGVELLDFAGPIEVFTTAARVHARRHPGAAPPFAVHSIAHTASPVQARAGQRLLADATIGDHAPLDVLVVPGGVVDGELARPEVTAWIASVAGGCRLVASVCTGAFLLAKAGLLDGLRVTTHWEDMASLQADFPQIEVVSGPRWLDGGTRVTSAGISAGIDMSLHLVERLADRELALATARQMDYDWRDADVRGVE